MPSEQTGANFAPVSPVDIEALDLAKRFGETPIFSDVSFRLARGEATALVGANGTGKSTLLRCLMGLIPTSGGNVRLLGQQTNETTGRQMREIRAQVGLVSQKHNLVPRLSVLSNVVHGLLGKHPGVRHWSHALAPQSSRDAAMQALERVGLSDFANRRADRLSGGQSQRVAIARAIVGAPKILFADEPCASLDPSAGEDVIDVHGDAFERQVMPRPGVFFPMETAVLETDRQLAANGIATTYHSITLSYEPGLRSVKRGREMMQAIRDLAPRLTVENRIQLRWETFAFEALETLDWAMDAPLKPSLAFNDHLSMAMRSDGTVMQERLFEHNPDFAVMDLSDAALFEVRYRKHTERSGLNYDDHKTLVHKVWSRRPDVVDTLQTVAAKARAKNVPMLSHDDTQAETRKFYHDLGATTSEFPMTIGPVDEARAHGDLIIFGSPNAVRGGSHIGSLGAADMVEAGLCDVLASDYYYPAMLAAVDRLDREKRADRFALWSLVSSGPARAMQLEDRGEIAIGKRADLVLVDWPEGQTPAIQGTWVAGRCAYRAMPAG